MLYAVSSAEARASSAKTAAVSAGLEKNISHPLLACSNASTDGASMSDAVRAPAVESAEAAIAAVMRFASAASMDDAVADGPRSVRTACSVTPRAGSTTFASNCSVSPCR